MGASHICFPLIRLAVVSHPMSCQCTLTFSSQAELLFLVLNINKSFLKRPFLVKSIHRCIMSGWIALGSSGIVTLGIWGDPAANTFTASISQGSTSHQKFLEIFITILFGVGISRIQGFITATWVTGFGKSLTAHLISPDSGEILWARMMLWDGRIQLGNAEAARQTSAKLWTIRSLILEICRSTPGLQCPLQFRCVNANFLAAECFAAHCNHIFGWFLLPQLLGGLESIWIFSLNTVLYWKKVKSSKF